MAYLNDTAATTAVCGLCGGLLNPGVAHVCPQPWPGFAEFPGRCIYCGAPLTPNTLHTCLAPGAPHTTVELHDPAVEPLRQEVKRLRECFDSFDRSLATLEVRIDALEAALRAKE